MALAHGATLGSQIPVGIGTACGAVNPIQDSELIARLEAAKVFAKATKRYTPHTVYLWMYDITGNAQSVDDVMRQVWRPSWKVNLAAFPRSRLVGGFWPSPRLRFDMFDEFDAVVGATDNLLLWGEAHDAPLCRKLIEEHILPTYGMVKHEAPRQGPL